MFSIMFSEVDVSREAIVNSKGAYFKYTTALSHELHNTKLHKLPVKKSCTKRNSS